MSAAHCTDDLALPPIAAIGSIDGSRESARTPASRRGGGQRLLAREQRRGTQLLVEALDQNRLRLTRRPRVRLSDMTTVAEEVSLHWPRAGWSPSAALSACADDRVTQRVGRWMIEQACAIAGELQNGAAVSLAVGPAMLTGPLAEDVAAALGRSGLSPRRLELRLSETALHEPSAKLLLSMAALSDLGVRLALANFGMRHGSVTLLHRLPLNAIHLDPWLTHDASPGGQDAAVAAALVTMAHALGLTVAACAVDSPGRLAGLRRLGIDECLARSPASGSALPERA